MKPLSKPFFVAGVRYSEEAKLNVVPPGTPVDVTHCPENTFDPFALQLSISGVKIGHVPRSDQAAWFYFTMMEVPVRCVVDVFDRNYPPYEQTRCHFECNDMFITTVKKVGHPVV